MIDHKIVQTFIKTLNDNAPLGEYKGYKFPYKPILVISIISCVKDVDLIFNHPIKIDEASPITKMYYDLLTNSETIYEYLTKSKGKCKWFLSYNHEVQKSVVFNIFDMPASKLKAEGIWKVDKKNHTVTISIDADKETLQDYKTVFYNEAIKSLKKCVPDYKDLSCDEIIDYKEYLKQQLISGIDVEHNEITKRKYQHIFKKEVSERDQKCMLCNLGISSCLEAAHIKPYCNCKNDIERYDDSNGILLCSNHHKMFDRGLFSFDENWSIIYAKSIDEPTQSLIRATLDKGYLSNFKNFSHINDYLLYRNKYLFNH